jgi:hypothetical protein
MRIEKTVAIEIDDEDAWLCHNNCAYLDTRHGWCHYSHVPLRREVAHGPLRRAAQCLYLFGSAGDPDEGTQPSKCKKEDCGGEKSLDQDPD